jgi:hypothetical protein
VSLWIKRQKDKKQPVEEKECHRKAEPNGHEDQFLFVGIQEVIYNLQS